MARPLLVQRHRRRSSVLVAAGHETQGAGPPWGMIYEVKRWTEERQRVHASKRQPPLHPTATLREHTLLAQGFMGMQKATFLRYFHRKTVIFRVPMWSKH